MADYIEATKKKNEEAMLIRRREAQEVFENKHRDKMGKYEGKTIKITDKAGEKGIDEVHSLL